MPPTPGPMLVICGGVIRTVSVATTLVLLPAMFVTTTVYLPAFGDCAAAMLLVAVVAAMFVSSLRHW